MSGRVVLGYAERMAGYQRVVEARSIATSSARLRELAQDPVRPVRVWTARNHNAPADALNLLIRDEDSTVRWNALLHARTPTEALMRLADEERDRWGDRTFIVRGHIVHHPNTPERLRQSLMTAGACKDCSNACHGWRVYTHRHPWQSRYQPAGEFRRTDAETADQMLSWQRDDQAFFAAGACHILAWAYVEANPGTGFRIYGLRRRGERYSHHVYISDGLWAFDHCGWTLATELRQSYDAEVFLIERDLDIFCAEHNHRRPDQFAYLPWQRARDFIARYDVGEQADL